jgi:hypothetical protein
VDRGASGENGLATAALSRTVILPDCIRDGADIGCNRRISRRQFIDIADFDVGGNDSRPFGARAEEPTAPTDDPRCMERVTWDEELYAFPAAYVRTDDDALARAVAAQQ